MLRPADCQICFALPRKISLARPTVSRRSSSTCIPSVTGTAKQHSVASPTNQGASSFSVRVRGRRFLSLVFVVAVHSSCLCPDASCPLSTEQPASTPRVSYSTTHMFIGCRLDFAVVSRVVFKVFPCGLWVVGLTSPPCNRGPNQRTNAGW